MNFVHEGREHSYIRSYPLFLVSAIDLILNSKFYVEIPRAITQNKESSHHKCIGACRLYHLQRMLCVRLQFLIARWNNPLTRNRDMPIWCADKNLIIFITILIWCVIHLSFTSLSDVPKHIFGLFLISLCFSIRHIPSSSSLIFYFSENNSPMLRIGFLLGFFTSQPYSRFPMNFNNFFVSTSHRYELDCEQCSFIWRQEIAKWFFNMRKQIKYWYFFITRISAHVNVIYKRKS